MTTNHSTRRTYLITGANSGVGFATAGALATSDTDVILAVRNIEKGKEAAREIKKFVGDSNLHIQYIDLASLQSIKTASEEMLDKFSRIDVLINNAGIHDLRGGETSDGVELNYGINYLGPFYLTRLLIGRLLETATKSGEARVVNVSSWSHTFAWNFDPLDPLPHPRLQKRESYSESKLCNILHTNELARRYGDKNLFAHSVHPGYVNSNIFRKEHWPGNWQWVVRLTSPWQIPARKGAMPAIFAATSPEATKINGRYWTRKGETKPKLPFDEREVSQRLWERTEEVIFSINKSQSLNTL